MKLVNLLSATLIIGVLLTLPACHSQEGPAETAGKNIDQAVEKVGEKIQIVGEKIQDSVDGEKK